MKQAPLEIVVAMDISGSMGAAIEDLKTAVRQFIARLKPTDQVTLVAFNQEMFVLTQRESDQAKLSAAIDRLTAWGGTTLYDVIIQSLDLLSRQPGRRSLVVFSDGEDQSSQATFAVVDRAVRGSDAGLFMVALGRGREQATLRETLEALAEPSGGRALFAEKPEELGERVRGVAQRADASVFDWIRIDERRARRRVAKARSRPAGHAVSRACPTRLFRASST